MLELKQVKSSCQQKQAQEKHYSINKNKSIFKSIIQNKIIIILIIVTISTLLLFTGIVYTDGNENPIQYENVIVEPGQSLWEIAEANYGNQNDLRKKIYEIREINQLETANLTPGQKLKLPEN